MMTLPEILHDAEYKSTWEWDGWKPKAKEDAPIEIKEAIEEWLEEDPEIDDVIIFK